MDDYLLPERVIGKTFRFCGELGGKKWTFSDQFFLDPNGTVGGYSNNNESAWKVQDGCLILIRGDGATSNIMTIQPGETDRIHLAGRFLFHPDVAFGHLYEIMPSKTYFIGPSHIHPEFTSVVTDEITDGILFRDVHLDGNRGLPNWSRYIDKMIEEKTSEKKNIIWMVSDYKFNNSDYLSIKALQGRDELFLDVMGHPGNIDRTLMGPEHIEVLGRHTIKILNYITSRYRHIKLIFWCLFVRSKCNSSSYPSYLWYDTIKNYYWENTIDIEQFISVEGFKECIFDEGGHPNKKGYELLDKMIRSAFP